MRNARVKGVTTVVLLMNSYSRAELYIEKSGRVRPNFSAAFRPSHPIDGSAEQNKAGVAASKPAVSAEADGGPGA